MIYKDLKGLKMYQFTKVSPPIQTLSPKIQKSGKPIFLNKYFYWSKVKDLNKSYSTEKF